MIDGFHISNLDVGVRSDSPVMVGENNLRNNFCILLLQLCVVHEGKSCGTTVFRYTAENVTGSQKRDQKCRKKK